VKAKVAAGEINPRKETKLPSLELKAWAADNRLRPSAGQLQSLATRLLHSDQLVEQIEKWFSKKRMDRFLKEEQQREALADPSSAQHAEHIVLRLMTAAAQKIACISSPFGKADYEALLGDERISLSTRGTHSVLRERAFENRHHIANMLHLSLAEIEQVCTAPSCCERPLATCLR
tara:strand:+ start:2093 stop:2620 length:528 start_codon:yes stop_codon:yes gene_type:complete